MKDINEIERLSPEDLERIASDTSVKVPEDLKASLEALVGAAELAEKTEAEQTAARRPLLWVIPAVAAALVAAVLVFRNVPSRPQDTFSDPYLAYAEVQKAIGQVSRKRDAAAEIAGNAVPVMEKTEDILNRIMK